MAVNVSTPSNVAVPLQPTADRARYDNPEWGRH